MNRGVRRIDLNETLQRRGGGPGGALGQTGLAELLADSDEFGGQALVATEAGDLLVGGADLVGEQGAVPVLVAALEVERPVEAMEIADGDLRWQPGLPQWRERQESEPGTMSPRPALGWRMWSRLASRQMIGAGREPPFYMVGIRSQY